MQNSTGRFFRLIRFLGRFETDYKFVIIRFEPSLVAHPTQYEILSIQILLRGVSVTTEKITIEDLRATVVQEAIAFFEGDRVAAEKWLTSPVRGLGNRAPIASMDSIQEIQKVRDLIGRLEHGVFT